MTDWQRLAYPRLCGLLAVRPTRLSYVMHSAGYRALDLPFTYATFDTDDTAGAISAMRALGLRGLSLTIPHKEAALPLVDEVSDLARRIGAINTVTNDGSSLRGENTDYHGIRAAFAEAGASLAGARALIFGAGGAASAAVVAAMDDGAAEIGLANRSIDRGRAMAARFGITAVPWESWRSFAPTVLLNATPIGSHLAHHDDELWPLDGSNPLAPVVFDMVTRETKLLSHTARTGGKAVAGTRMLLFQAVMQFSLFTERADVPQRAMEEALNAELAAR